MIMGNQNELFLAFDYGEKRTGVALGQSITKTARPLTTIISSGNEPNWQAIDALIKEWQPSQIVVGIPDDTENNKALRKKISNFCNQLSKRSNLPISKHDETLTSDEAYRQLKNKRQTVKNKIHKSDIDQIAAAILLESWMDANLPV